MPASYTSLLRFAKPGLGDTGWGTTVNGGFTDMTEQALTGAISKAVTVAGPNTLGAIADGASSDARNQFITLTGPLASPATLTVPAGLANNSKLYFIKNSAGNSVTITTGGVDTVVVPDGASMALRVTTTGVEQALTHQTTLSIGTLTLTNALGATSGGTGQTGYAVGDLLYASSTTALSKLAAVATGNVLRSGGVGVAPAWGPVALGTDVSGTLPVANGGTGAATLAANNVLLGNGTSALQAVAPGTNGNVLTSNGTTWTSATPAAAPVTSVNGLTGAVSMTGLGDIGSYAVLIIATNTNVAAGSTVAGSDLRHSWTPNTGVVNATTNGYSAYGANRSNSSASYNGGGTSLTGTWRKVSTGATYGTITVCCVGTTFYWMAALYVRIS